MKKNFLFINTLDFQHLFKVLEIESINKKKIWWVVHRSIFCFFFFYYSCQDLFSIRILVLLHVNPWRVVLGQRSLQAITWFQVFLSNTNSS